MALICFWDRQLTKMVMSNHGRELAIQIYLTKNLFQTLFARQRITMHAFFLLNMKATIFLRVLINLERICLPIHFGVQSIKATKVLEFVNIVVLKVRSLLMYTVCI